MATYFDSLEKFIFRDSTSQVALEHFNSQLFFFKPELVQYQALPLIDLSDSNEDLADDLARFLRIEEGQAQRVYLHHSELEGIVLLETTIRKIGGRLLLHSRDSRCWCLVYFMPKPYYSELKIRKSQHTGFCRLWLPILQSNEIQAIEVQCQHHSVSLEKSF